MLSNFKYKYLFFLILPIIAVAVWYSPILFKGYSLASPNDQIILAKNIAQTGMYAAESDLNVLLSSSLIKEKAHISFIGNKLTAYLYAFIFKNFGFWDWNRIILFSAFLNAITLLVFTFLVFYLFNFRTSLVFSLVYVFLPFVWQTAIGPGGYEFALFFVSLFFLFYFLAQKSKYDFIFFIFSGIFLTLACLARETFLLFIPIFFLYLLLKKEKKMVVLIFIPVFILLSLFYLPDFLASRNVYLQMFGITGQSEKLEANDFLAYGEFYPDPYTYRFNRENFLMEFIQRRDQTDLVTSLLMDRGASVNVDAVRLSFGRRIMLGGVLLVGNAARFVSWEEIGGPFVFILMILGLYELKKKNLSFFQISLWLILGIVFLISFVLMVGRSHLIDFGVVLALLVSLGLISLFERFEIFRVLSGFVLLLVLYNLLLAGHTYWGRVYDNKENLTILNYASKIDELKISDKDIIAFGANGLPGAEALNYLKDKSFIVFQQRTIKKLLEDGELDSAFRTFDVTHILGYSDDLSQKILKEVNVVNISSSESSSGNIEEVSFENYGLKNWLMSLIK